MFHSHKLAQSPYVDHWLLCPSFDQEIWEIKLIKDGVAYTTAPWIVVPEPPVSLKHVCHVTELLEVVYVTDVESGQNLLDTPVPVCRTQLSCVSLLMVRTVLYL